MAYRLYIVPVIGTGVLSDPRRPKYISDIAGLTWAAMDYGFQPLYLAAADLTLTDDAAVIANGDVFAFPFDLTPNLNQGQVNSAKTAFELALIPAQWVSASNTWHDVARIVAGMFQFMQRLNAILGNIILIDSSTKLNIQWSSIPSNIQTAIIDSATSLGYDTSFIQATTQLRTILKSLSDQWGDKTFVLNLFTF
jgi:hypothetical protein